MPLPPDTTQWQISVYRGFGFGETSGAGSGSLPGAGEAFTTNGGSPTRRVTSWSFGDGAVLLNDVLASFNRPERITALDSVLTSEGIGHDFADGFGARVTRKITPRMSLEIGVDVSPTTYTVLPGAVTGIRATSNSFVTAFDGLVTAGQGTAFTSPVLSSSFVTSNGTGLDLITTGAMVLGAKPIWRLRPYVTVGGGLAMGVGEATASLVGRYAFTLPSGGRVNETDAVTIRFKGGLGLVALAGGGVQFRLSRTSGVQVDARLLLVQNHVDTKVTTAPAVEASSPADAIWSSLTPGIQFVTSPSTSLFSNLSAPALSGSRTLNGSGFTQRVSVTLGYYFRF